MNSHVSLSATRSLPVENADVLQETVRCLQKAARQAKARERRLARVRQEIAGEVWEELGLYALLNDDDWPADPPYQR